MNQVTAAALQELHRLHRQLTDLKERLERGPKQELGRIAVRHVGRGHLTTDGTQHGQVLDLLTPTKLRESDAEVLNLPLVVGANLAPRYRLLRPTVDSVTNDQRVRWARRMDAHHE